MKNLISKEEKDRIDLICNEFVIKHYSINSDGSIDVDGDVFISRKKLIHLPLKFGKVSGHFSCSFNHITTLEGSPHTVGGDFNASENRLTSLEGGPHTVVGDFYCSYNNLITLEGSPSIIGGDLICNSNNITSTYSGDIDIEFDGDFYSGDTLLQLPQLVIDHMGHIKLILKYQRHFFIWNDDLTLNEENFQNLIAEIDEGLE
jgi:hypothetical protein